MALVPCDSCRRHVRAAEDACPFCKTVRVGTKVVVVAASAFVLAGCGETFSPAAKYGGPPAQPDVTTTTITVPEAGPADSATASATPPPDVPDASPRLTDTSDAGPGKRFAPVALYGGPPRKKPTPTP